MTFGHALGLVGFVALLVFIVFAFRQGSKVKPDRNQKPMGTDPNITGQGP
jgi:hypothetical protein